MDSPFVDIDFSTLKKGQPGAMLHEFFVNELKDIYWAEKHLTKAIPKMRKAATSPQLQKAFDEHLAVTEEQIVRLEQVFHLLNKKAEGIKCEAMEGIVKEAESVIEDTENDTMTRDVALIFAAQKVEHYEIATYGGLVQLALTMGMKEAAELLHTTLQEEKEADEALSHIAVHNINWEATQEHA